MGRIVKFRLITWFEPVEDVTAPGGQVMREHIASMGEEVELPEGEEARLEKLGAFYSEEEQAAIEDGSYNGHDRFILSNFRAGKRPEGIVTPALGEGIDTSGMDAEQLSEYIRENRLNVDQTLALLPEDASEDQINTLYDAENYASENDPRKGVTDRLEARLAALAAAS
jgi:hypothetical protein